jgi:glycosyltransferase involved in cell wall biosynthesis
MTPGGLERRHAPPPADGVPAAGAATGEAVGRNAPCPCGSGWRYKACCGAAERSMPAAQAGATPVGALMARALALQRAGRLTDAAALYRDALARRPGLPDAVHMLGVTELQAGEYTAALRHLRRAADLFDWKPPAVRHNLGLAIAAVVATSDRPEVARRWEAYDRWRDTPRAAADDAPPRVSVVVPSFNHERYVEAALESVFRQTYPNTEIVIVDDGSADGSVGRIREAVRRSPFPVRFSARANRGAAATINEAVALSGGDFVNVLNSDDRFAPTRIATMVAAVARAGMRWGFSRATLMDETGAVVPPAASPRAADLAYRSDDVAACDTVGTAFLSGNPAITSGALFVDRALFDRLGGFADLRYNHDWDFCLRASLVAEPAFVPSPEYEYRLHPANTILESAHAAKREADTMFTRFYRHAVALPAAENPFAPVPAVWGARFFERALASGHAALLPGAVLCDLADRVLATCGGKGTA